MAILIINGNNILQLIKSGSDFELTIHGIELIVAKRLVELLNFYKTHCDSFSRIRLPLIYAIKSESALEAAQEIVKVLLDHDKTGRSYFIYRESLVGTNGHKFTVCFDYDNKAIIIMDFFIKNHDVLLYCLKLELQRKNLCDLAAYRVFKNDSGEKFKLQYNSGACECFAYQTIFLLERYMALYPDITLLDIFSSSNRILSNISEDIFVDPNSEVFYQVLPERMNFLIRIFPEDKKLIERSSAEDLHNRETMQASGKFELKKGGYIYHKAIEDAEYIKQVSVNPPSSISITNFRDLLSSHRRQLDIERRRI